MSRNTQWEEVFHHYQYTLWHARKDQNTTRPQCYCQNCLSHHFPEFWEWVKEMTTIWWYNLSLKEKKEIIRNAGGHYGWTLKLDFEEKFRSSSHRRWVQKLAINKWMNAFSSSLIHNNRRIDK